MKLFKSRESLALCQLRNEGIKIGIEDREPFEWMRWFCEKLRLPGRRWNGKLFELRHPIQQASCNGFVSPVLPLQSAGRGRLASDRFDRFNPKYLQPIKPRCGVRDWFQS